MKHVIHSPLVLSSLAIATLLMLTAGASAQSPLFPTVQPVRPNGGVGPYTNLYDGRQPAISLPPGMAVQLIPRPPRYVPLLLPPNGNYSNRPYSYPATNGYGSSPSIPYYGGAGTGY